VLPLRNGPRAGREGQQGRTEARPARALEAGDLRTLYLDLLGRPPFAEEWGSWLGRGRVELLDALLGGAEFWDHWYEEQLYYLLLIDSFRPETPGAREIPAKLVEGRLDVRGALHRLALSPSFDMRNPGADTFVTVVMEQLAGMTVQKSPRELEIGKALYDGGSGVFLGSAGSCQSDVVRIAIESKAATRHFVEREHERLLRRSADGRELGGWTRELERDARGYLDILRRWLQSDGYDERLAHPVQKPNRLFVRGLFVDLLGRLPAKDEVEPMRNALDGLSDSRPLRAVLVRLLLDSGSVDVPAKDAIEDPTEWIAGLFPRLLGREAAPDELATFARTFHRPDCRPATLLLALLSDPAYHRY